MRFWSVFVLLILFGLFGDEGVEQGREGNELYEQGRYAEAEGLYRNGLAAHEDTTDAVYASLQNNLGVALLQQEAFRDARAAFKRARRTAPTEEARVRALFNAGTAAAGQGNISSALRRYRRVLLLDPSHDAARHNYEYLKRQRGQEQRRRSESSQREPSPYARRIKKRADSLVVRRRYGEAAALMQKGLRRDSTVRAYHDFMERIDDVRDIQETP